MSTSPVVADLEAALAAAKADPASTPEQVAAIEAALAAVQPTPVAAEPVDTSGLPGGVDSAPVNEPDPLPGAGGPVASSPTRPSLRPPPPPQRPRRCCRRSSRPRRPMRSTSSAS